MNKNMANITLRPADPQRDFRQLAAWFTILEDEYNSEAGLREFFEKNRQRIIHHKVAGKTQGELLGFSWATRDHVEPDWMEFDLFIRPEQRRQGLGDRLYTDLLEAVKAARVKKLRVRVRDISPECRVFAERRGFSERKHQIAMALDLGAFDDQLYEGIIDRLKVEGFQFTSMEELGNTPEAQRRLYLLNDSTAITTPGTKGEHSWASFEDFQKSVCQSDWYSPGGQFVAIDTSNGAWAAMCAISRFEGNEYANTLHIGVDRPYRGRKLGQAVRVLALRYARDVLKAHSVRTTHNGENLPALAIDRKLGYVPIAGTSTMEKVLE